MKMGVEPCASILAYIGMGGGGDGIEPWMLIARDDELTIICQEEDEFNDELAIICQEEFEFNDELTIICQ